MKLFHTGTNNEKFEQFLTEKKVEKFNEPEEKHTFQKP